MALTNAEKQAAWRKRREQHIRDLERRVAELEAQLRSTTESDVGRTKPV